MEVTMTNFRFHRNATFKIPDSGMMLLRAGGGKGKTTILNAIFFALYGVCRKPYSHGTKTCKVVLNYPRYGIKVTRTKTPNRLLVTHDGTEYEDDNAQGVIDKVMGMTAPEFYASSYFDQNKKSSILAMSPSEQLSFIEIIAFENKNHEEFKAKIKDHIKTLEKERDGVASQLSLLESQVKSCSERLTKLYDENSENPYSLDNVLDPENIKSELSECSDKLKELQRSIKPKKAELMSLRKAETENRELEDEKLKLETQIASLKVSIANLGDVKSESDIKILSDEHAELQQLFQYTQDSIKVSELQEEFNKASDAHFETLRKKIIDLKKRIISEEDLTKIKQSLENYEKFKQESDEKERLRTQLENNKKDALLILSRTHKFLLEEYGDDNLFSKSLKAKKVNWDSLQSIIQKKINVLTENVSEYESKLKDLQCELLTCPKCRINLQLKTEDNGLTLKWLKSDLKTLNNMKDDIPTLKLELSSAKMNLAALEQCLSSVKASLETVSVAIPEKNSIEIISIEEFREFSIKVAEQSDLMSQIEKLENSLKSKNLPSSINKLKVQLSDKKKGIPKNLGTHNLEELSAKMRELEKVIEKSWMTRGDHSKHTRDLLALEKNLKAIGNRFLKSIPDTQKLLGEVRFLDKEIEKLTNKIINLNTNLGMTDSYLLLRHTYSELESLKSMESSLRVKNTDINNRIEGAEGLEKASIEAEFMALEKTIESINEHAKIYLCKLFPTPIVARLQVKRTTKKGDASIRPNINMYVEYQGEVYDDIDEFSGSERQRCDIAFLFGVNDMMGSNILMLDECFTNLHEDQQSEMLECIHEITHENVNKSKQVIIIAPRVIEGVFDHVVDIEEV